MVARVPNNTLNKTIQYHCEEDDGYTTPYIINRNTQLVIDLFVIKPALNNTYLQYSQI